MKRLWIKQIFVILAMSLIAQFAWALQSPVTMVQGMANNMIAGLKKSKSQLRSNPTVVYRLVRRNLLPYADLNSMAASAVGPAWRKASASQRNQFKRLFVNVVISTYATALRSYDGDVIRIYPLRRNYSSARTVTVRSLVVRRNGQRIPVSYNLVRRGNSWKIYDFSIENVSMVQSYRAQFASALSRGGMSNLIASLQKRGR